MIIQLLDVKRIIEWGMCILVALIFYKNAAKKIQVALSFYKSLSESRLLKEGVVLKLLSSLIVTSELVIAITILVPRYRAYTCILGIVIQLFYFTVMISNYNKSSEYNCGCFSINAPKKFDFKGILLNQLFLFIFISILILKIK